MNQRFMRNWAVLWVLCSIFHTAVPMGNLQWLMPQGSDEISLPSISTQVGVGVAGVTTAAAWWWFTNRGNEVLAQRLPIVYDPSYDISFFGVEKLHPFDSCKYSKIYNFLVESGVKPEQFVRPSKVTDEQLLTVHGKGYLDSLRNNTTLARISEVVPLAYVPNCLNFLLARKLLDPMKLATGGTLQAVDLAKEKGWAINLSGGYHHAKRQGGEGFCFFSDIALAVNKLKAEKPGIKVMIVDLDTHQGNGHESYFCEDKDVAIFDIYEKLNFPFEELEGELRKKITYGFPLLTLRKDPQSWVDDKKYLTLLRDNLSKAIEESKPEFIIYNAGTDIYEKDRLGHCMVTKGGIIERDLHVFEQARQRKIPIVMVLSGGYHADSAGIVADSIKNLLENKKLDLLGSDDHLFNAVSTY